MFKTIEECRLELVSYSVMNVPTEEITMLAAEKSGRPRLFKDAEKQNADWMPCSAARASFGNEDKTGNDSEADRKLMRYLAEHQHMTPYEYQHAVFLIECPLFIRSQIHRHRTFSYNEISRRYTSEDLEFWIPDNIRGQSKSNKQASDGVIEDSDGHLMEGFTLLAETLLECYNHMLDEGVAREQARAILPQSLLTRFYMGGILRNWQHFIELRDDDHAQYEVRVIAQRIARELHKLWPESCEALDL